MIVKPMLTPADPRDLPVGGAAAPTKPSRRLGIVSVIEVTLTASASTPSVSAVTFWKASMTPLSTCEALTPVSWVVAVNSTMVLVGSSRVGFTVGLGVTLAAAVGDLEGGVVAVVEEGGGVGRREGEEEGERVGVEEGERVGVEEGERVGEREGEEEGERVGDTEGAEEGERVGLEEGENVGVTDGEVEGEKVGEEEGEKVGDTEGETEGRKVGLAEGEKVGN
jgi:hypothetical protein